MQWQYKRMKAIGDISKDQILEQMGSLGWELVAIIQLSPEKNIVEFYFKRPIPKDEV